MDKILLINIYKKQIFIISIISLLIHQGILILIGYDVMLSLVLIVAGIAFFFAGWGIMFIVLGFQLFNQLIPKSVFKWICYFFIFVIVLGYVISIIIDIVLPFFMTIKTIFPISMTPAMAGMIFSSFRQYEKSKVQLNPSLNKLY